MNLCKVLEQLWINMGFELVRALPEFLRMAPAPSPECVSFSAF
jgi:hypothetical protein